MSARVTADIDALHAVLPGVQLDHDAASRAATELADALERYWVRCPAFRLEAGAIELDLAGHVARSRQLAEQFSSVATQLATAGAVGQLGAIWRAVPTDVTSDLACVLEPGAATLARYRAFALLGPEVRTSTTETYAVGAGVDVGVAELARLVGLTIGIVTLADGSVDVVVSDTEHVGASVGRDLGRVEATVGAAVAGARSYTLHFPDLAAADDFLRTGRLEEAGRQWWWSALGLGAAAVGLGVLVPRFRDLFDNPPDEAVSTSETTSLDLAATLGLDLGKVDASLDAGLTAWSTTTDDRAADTGTAMSGLAFDATADVEAALAHVMGGVLAGVLPELEAGQSGELTFAITRDDQGRALSLVVTTFVVTGDDGQRRSRAIDLTRPGREGLAAALPDLDAGPPSVVALGAALAAYGVTSWDARRDERLERSDEPGLSFDEGVVIEGSKTTWEVVETTYPEG